MPEWTLTVNGHWVDDVEAAMRRANDVGCGGIAEGGPTLHGFSDWEAL